MTLWCQISPFEQFLLVLFGSKNCTCLIQGLQHGWVQEQGWGWQQPLCWQPQGLPLPAHSLTAAWSQLHPPAAGLPSPGSTAGPWERPGPSSCLFCCLQSLSLSSGFLFQPHLPLRRKKLFCHIQFTLKVSLLGFCPSCHGDSAFLP